MSDQQDLEPGFYWLQSVKTGELEVAEWDGSRWFFIGSLFTTSMIDVIGPAADPAHLLGPRIEPPHQIEIVSEALA